MGSGLRVSRGGFAVAIAVMAAACGTSTSRGGDDGMSGTLSSGGTAGSTGGTAGGGGTGDTSVCVNPACPDTLPTNGDACSGCNFPPLGCSFDEQAVDGLVYTALCNAGQWFVFGQQTLPTACCATDDDCFASPCSDGCREPVCVNGSCRLTGSDECWRDDQCPSDGECSGSITCGHACAAEQCEQYDQPGVCVPKGQGCCLSDGDCSGTAHCIQGVCKAASRVSGCYVGADCSSAGECVDVSVCRCGADCPEPDVEGHCEYMR
jgi:hypothetical protein